MYGALALDLNSNPSSNVDGLPGVGAAHRLSLSASTPPPPRRVQSEAHVQGSGSVRNPRGIATRNGRPALPDPTYTGTGTGTGAAEAAGDERPRGEILASIDPPAAGARSGSPAPVKKRTANPSPPRVSLGPAEGQPLGGVEVMESQTLTKRKAD